MSIIRVSELENTTGITSGSLIMTAYGDGTPKVSKKITVENMLSSEPFGRFYQPMVPMGDRVVTLGLSKNVGTIDALYLGNSGLTIGSTTIKNDFGLHIDNSVDITGSLIVSGSQEIIGTNHLVGAQQLTGSLTVSGSTIQIGNNTLLGNTILSGSINVSGNTTFNGVHRLSGSNTIVGNTIMSGSLEVSGSTNFHNHIITMTGSMYTSGSQNITGSLDIMGNVNLRNGSEFYLDGNKLFNYGQFSDNTTQSGSANTAYVMKVNTVDFAHNTSIVSGSRITVENTGIYNLQFSTQLSNTSNSNITFDIWLAYTGSNVINSNTRVDVNKSAGQSGKTIAAWNWMIPIVANDYVEIMWMCDASTGQLFSTGSLTNPTRPAIPSVIATLTQVG